MKEFFIWLLVATLPFSLIGILTVYYWVIDAGFPSDRSNVIARIMSWWIGLTRSDKMASIFPLLRMDVWDMVKAVKKL